MGTKLEVPVHWRKAIDKVNQAKISLVIGETDSGKSTLVSFLHNKLGGSIIDSDIGQGDIGPPTTIALSTDGEEMLDGYFVGSITPSRHFCEMLIGTKRMVERASTPIFIDTTGMVHGSAARALKTGKIEFIEPDLLILLGDGELDYYYTYKRVGIDVIGLPKSKNAKKRSRAERRKARKKAFQEYFADSEQRRIDLERLGLERTIVGSGENISEEISELVDVKVYRAERLGDTILLISDRSRIRPTTYKNVKRRMGVEKFNILKASDFENLLVGLVGRKNDFLGIGIMEDLDFDSFQATIFLPRNTVKRVASIQLGSIRVDRYGEELGLISLC